MLQERLETEESDPDSQDPYLIFDAENKLVRVVSNGKTVNYKYDGLGRRVEKEIVDVGGTEVAATDVVVQITADTTIGENDTQFEGRTLQVSGRTLTVNGPHIFANLILTGGARLTQNGNSM